MLFSKKAPELVGINSQAWFNSGPLSLEGLKGKVVLLDFWSYSCVNCIRALPSLRAMWQKYKFRKFMLIGIHTPEFEFEKKLENVAAAVVKHCLTYPVASDPEGVNWENYGNTYWPRAALIDASGKLVMAHVGESGYAEIDEKTAIELEQIGDSAPFVPIGEQRFVYEPGTSQEVYAGSLRNSGLGSARVCRNDGCREFVDQGKHAPNVIYPHGPWKQGGDCLEFFGNSGGWVSLKFFAKEVNAVLGGIGAAEVLLNGLPLTKENAGKDVELRDSKSIVRINRPDMYNLIRLEAAAQGDLKIIPFEKLRVYAYTFG